MKRLLTVGSLVATTFYSSSSIASLKGPPVSLAANEEIIGHGDFGPWAATAVQNESISNKSLRHASRCELRSNGIQLSVTANNVSVIGLNYGRSTDSDSSDDEVTFGIIDLTEVVIDKKLYKTRFVSSEHPRTSGAITFGHGQLEVQMHGRWMEFDAVTPLIVSSHNVSLFYKDSNSDNLPSATVRLQTRYLTSAIKWCRERL